ncbi:MAG: right-handed parallel beta-helix repeat-containing protein [Phycisphaerales bacterium]
MNCVLQCVAAIWAVLPLCSALTAATIEVPSHYRTIQDAVDAAMDGDLILVAPGVYEEDVFVNDKSITLMGSDGAEKASIVGTGKATAVRLSPAVDDEVIFSGFTVSGASPLYACVTITDDGDALVSKCCAIGDPADPTNGFRSFSGRGTFRECFATDCRSGFLIQNTDDTVVEDSLATNCFRGYKAEFSAAEFVNVAATDCSEWGILIELSADDTEIRGGVLTNCGIDAWGDDLVIEDLQVTDANEHSRIRSDDLRLANSTFVNSQLDVRGDRTEVIDCDFIDCTPIVALVGEDVLVSGCTFTSMKSGPCTLDSAAAGTTLIDCVFENTSGPRVLEVSNDGVIIERCVFRNNTISHPFLLSAAIRVDGLDDCTISDCVFEGNTSENEIAAGCMVINSSNVSIERCRFLDNQAQDGAAAI